MISFYGFSYPFHNAMCYIASLVILIVVLLVVILTVFFPSLSTPGQVGGAYVESGQQPLVVDDEHDRERRHETENPRRKRHAQRLADPDAAQRHRGAQLG